MLFEKKFGYSGQAMTIIKNLKHFDKEAFEKWFVEELAIGAGPVLEYLKHLEKR